ncbi:hypothetical protein [Pseudonocardia pini]|uniref:hypothetical protein n=1 Tax=Pseudonocardia pini TaxID=2758030 RepID=UPI0015F074FA|nr:hypothetical protein [Pseudonocardia pini]
MLRAGNENVDWTADGVEATWPSALLTGHRALQELIARELERHEYRIEVGGLSAIVWPGIEPTGRFAAPLIDELPLWDAGLLLP